MISDWVQIFGTWLTEKIKEKISDSGSVRALLKFLNSTGGRQSDLETTLGFNLRIACVTVCRVNQTVGYQTKHCSHNALKMAGLCHRPVYTVHSNYSVG